MKRIYGIVRDFARKLTKDNIIILCSLLPFTSLTEKNLVAAIVDVMPDFLDALTVLMIQQMYEQSVKILPIAIIVMLWSSSKGMLALMVGLNAVNEVEETRSYFLLRLEAAFYMVITVVALLVSLVLSVFGKTIVYTIYSLAPNMGGLLYLFMRFRFLLVWLLLIVVFVVTYTYVPNKKMKMRHQIPGPVVTALGWSAFSFAFSIYVEHFQGMSAYGSLSTIIIMMFWLYCCIYILLIGANLNRYCRPLIRLMIRG